MGPTKKEKVNKTVDVGKRLKSDETDKIAGKIVKYSTPPNILKKDPELCYRLNKASILDTHHKLKTIAGEQPTLTLQT